MSAPHILETLATLCLSSFFVIITISFFKFRLVRKQEELEKIVLSISSEKSKSFKDEIANEFSPKDYVLSLIFLTMVTFIGFYFLFLGWSLYKPDADGHVRSVLLAGSNFWVDTIKSQEIEKRSISVVAWAILGGFLGGAQLVYRRYATIDLTPGVFFSTGLRMILAPTLSLIISFLMGLEDPNNASSNIIIIIAFLTGLFPERGMKLLLNKVSSVFPEEHEVKTSDQPLQTIEGISYLHRLRLNEIGIDNVQNLAQFNFLMLIIKTPFPIRILLDWVAQAKLISQFPIQIDQLKGLGIRTALDFKDTLNACNHQFEEISKLSGIAVFNLAISQQQLENDQSIWLLSRINTTLERGTIG